MTPIGLVKRRDAVMKSDTDTVCGIVAVNWAKNDWAFSCTFQGSDLANVSERGDRCTEKCNNLPGDAFIRPRGSLVS